MYIWTLSILHTYLRHIEVVPRCLMGYPTPQHFNTYLAGYILTFILKYNHVFIQVLGVSLFNMYTLKYCNSNTQTVILASHNSNTCN